MKFILGRIEAYKNKAFLNDESHETIHVMPQEITPELQKYLGEDYESIHQTLVNTIGNLTLFSDVDKKKWGKLDFSRKLKDLKQSHLHLNKYFVNVNRWDKEAIEQRAEVLVNIALKIWPNFAEVQTNFSTLDVKGKKPTKVIIMGDKKPVSSWREVMYSTLETLIYIDRKAFDNKIIKQFSQYIAWEDKFRISRQLSNGAYIETHLDARSIYQFCREVTEFYGVSSDDFKVEWILK